MCTSVRNKVSCKVGFGKIHPPLMVVVVLYVHCASVYKLGLVKDTLEASTLLTGGGVVCASVYKQHSIVQKDAVV